MTVMASAIISPSLPGISDHFAGHADVLIKLILTMPALLIAVSGAFIGHLADHIGRKKLLLAALTLYGLAGFSGYLIDSLSMLLISRAALGVAVAGIMSMSTTLIGDYFKPEEQARFLGLQGSFMALGGVVFLNVGGILAEWHWRGPFLVYLLSIALLPVAMRVLYEPARLASRRDGDKTPSVHVDRALTALIYAAALVGMMLLYVVPTQLPFLLAAQSNSGSAAIGLAISSGTVTAAIVSFFYGRIKSYLSFASIYAIGFLLMAAGYALVGFAGSYAATLVGIAVNGLGLGLIMPNSTVWLMRITPAHARGRIMGGYTSMIFLGQFLSPLAVAPLAAALPSLNSVFTATAALSVLVAAILTTLSATLLRRDRSSEA